MSLNQRIIEHAKSQENYDTEDQDACHRLIKKLLIPVCIVNYEDREREEAILFDIFLTELHQFQNREGAYQQQGIWYIAELEDILAHEWHRKYSLAVTKVLGRFACSVCSKGQDIGEAERNCKAAKRNKQDQRARVQTTRPRSRLPFQWPIAMRVTGLTCCSTEGR
jgi:hypothetical protein